MRRRSAVRVVYALAHDALILRGFRGLSGIRTRIPFATLRRSVRRQRSRSGMTELRTYPRFAR